MRGGSPHEQSNWVVGLAPVGFGGTEYRGMFSDCGAGGPVRGPSLFTELLIFPLATDDDDSLGRCDFVDPGYEPLLLLAARIGRTFEEMIPRLVMRIVPKATQLGRNHVGTIARGFKILIATRGCPG
jgi:hypothetical protein